MLLLAISPSPSNREETLSTLRFGRQAKRIVNKPRVNEDRSPAELLAILKQRDAEIARLRSQVRHALIQHPPNRCNIMNAIAVQLTDAAAGVLPAEFSPSMSAAATEHVAKQDERIARLVAEVAMLRRENATLNEAAAASETALTALSLEQTALKARLQDVTTGAESVPLLEKQLAEANRALAELGVHVMGSDSRAAATAAESAARLADSQRAARDALAYVATREADLRAGIGAIKDLVLSASSCLLSAAEDSKGPVGNPRLFAVDASHTVASSGFSATLPDASPQPSVIPQVEALRRVATSADRKQEHSILDNTIAELHEATKVCEHSLGTCVH